MSLLGMQFLLLACGWCNVYLKSLYPLLLLLLYNFIIINIRYICWFRNTDANWIFFKNWNPSLNRSNKLHLTVPWMLGSFGVGIQTSSLSITTFRDKGPSGKLLNKQNRWPWLWSPQSPLSANARLHFMWFCFVPSALLSFCCLFPAAHQYFRGVGDVA